MATNAGLMAANVASRARDPLYMGTTQAQVLSLISQSQQVVNGIIGDQVSSQSLVIQPRTVLYQLSTFVPGAIKVLAVRDNSGRDLDPMGPLEALSWANLKWLTAVADAPRNFVMIGRDLLTIYPGVRSAQTVTVVYTNLTAAIANINDTTALTNEGDDALYDLTEFLLLLRGRDLRDCKDVLQRLQAHIKELQSESR